MQEMKISRQKHTYHFIIAAAIITAAYILLYAVIEQGLFSHSDYDSYTRQAASWWQGRASLPENITWLELAEYNEEIFVSFPPFPTVIQFLLYPIFGMNTPDNLINTIIALLSFVLIYRFLRERGKSGLMSSVLALLMTLGTNLFYLSVTGWVWFSAQTQSFLLCVLSVSLIYSKNKTAWYFSFLCLGLAFSCRPFQIVYAPLLFYMLYKNIDSQKGFIKTCVSCIKYVLPLVLVGVCAAVYNYMRFNSFFEFGHTYLPEFTSAPQFSLSYVPGNFLEILKLPKVLNSELLLPKFNGTLFFLVNPVFVLLAARLIKNKFSAKHLIYMICLIVHLVLLLSHKTMGGWQFGSRYLVDMVPFMLIIFAEPFFMAYEDSKDNILRARRAAVLPAILAVIAIAINIYGAIWYYTMPV